MAQRISHTRQGSYHANGKQEQNDLYNTGYDNPFQSMYQATIGSQRAKTSNGQRPGISQTPKINRSSKIYNGIDSQSKSMKKLHMSAKREQPRRFGEMTGEDGLGPDQPTQSIWQQNPCKYIWQLIREAVHQIFRLTNRNIALCRLTSSHWVPGCKNDPVY